MRTYYVYIMASRSPHPRLHEYVPHHSTRLLRRVRRCARCYRPGEAAQGLGSLTKDPADRGEELHVGGSGCPLVSRTSASTMTSPLFVSKAPRGLSSCASARNARDAKALIA